MTRLRAMLSTMPPDLAFRGGMIVGALLFPGVWMLTKLMTGWVPICL